MMLDQASRTQSERGLPMQMRRQPRSNFVVEGEGEILVQREASGEVWFLWLVRLFTDIGGHSARCAAHKRLG